MRNQTRGFLTRLRSTTGESGIPLDYLNGVSKAYSQYLSDYADSLPVIRIDSSKDTADIFDELVAEMSKITT